MPRREWVQQLGDRIRQKCLVPDLQFRAADAHSLSSHLRHWAPIIVHSVADSDADDTRMLLEGFVSRLDSFGAFTTAEPRNKRYTAECMIKSLSAAMMMRNRDKLAEVLRKVLDTLGARRAVDLNLRCPRASVLSKRQVYGEPRTGLVLFFVEVEAGVVA